MRMLLRFSALALSFSLSGCWQNGARSGHTSLTGVQSEKAESCMGCHNGASHNDYSGPGMENPHPFSGGGTFKCSICHGGYGAPGADMAASHVPPPPEIGDRNLQLTDAHAWFNKLTLTGLDKVADYQVGGVTYTWLDFLEFIQPGDLRVVTRGRGCGKCHAPHAQGSSRSPLATEMGIMSSALFTTGVPVTIPESQGLYSDTASDFGFRAVADPLFQFNPSRVGAVARLDEYPVHSVFGDRRAGMIFNNSAFDAGNLPNSVNPDGSVIPGSPLHTLFIEQVTFTCGDCHLGSSGQNNRYGDFRSSGCTACHMRYSQDGKSRTSDPNLNRTEPVNPDAIAASERPHVARHVIKSVARTVSTGEFLGGIDDWTCAGCHQGSNRTVLQYWGIRLDQNQNLRNRVQYPANPVHWQNTSQDTRLFDPLVANRTFNGRNVNQYILEEDYDGDNRDDTPEDIHYQAGLGCIDCHGSHDIHGGVVGDPNGTPIQSRQEQAVAIRCESCHGTIEAYAPVVLGMTYDGVAADCAVDAAGVAVRNVTRDGNGEYHLRSRLDGRIHYVKQVKDVVADNGKRHPTTGLPVYNAKASYAMGRVDADPSNGIGPQQTGAGIAHSGFSHTDSMSCAACHSSWSNNCIGCHLRGDYNTGNNFSNITGERIVYRQTNADFTYQTPVPFQLGVSARNQIGVISPNTNVFYGWKDRRGDVSNVFSFTDRHGFGNQTGVNGGGAFGALSHNVFMPHSIRGKVSATQEGPRYCVACHLTTEALVNYGTQYDTFRTAMNNANFAALDFQLLKTHIGLNTGNQRNSPFWVNMVAGLGSGLFLFDANGCPVNPLDTDPNRVGCNGSSPAAHYNLPDVALDIDRIVEPNGLQNSSGNHQMLDNLPSTKRDGSTNPNFAGPLGATLIQRLSDPQNGIILDSWIDADGASQGGASTFVGQ